MPYIDTSIKCENCNERYQVTMAVDKGVPSEYTRWMWVSFKYCPKCGNPLQLIEPQEIKRSFLTKIANFIQGLDQLLNRITE